MDLHKKLEDKNIRSDSYVNFEFVKPFCTCGKELSSHFFELTAMNSFMETMKDIFSIEELITVSQKVFLRNKEEVLSSNSSKDKEFLKFCCKMSLQFGRSTPLSLEDPREGVRKDQPPVSLPGALNRRKAIYWSS